MTLITLVVITVLCLSIPLSRNDIVAVDDNGVVIGRVVSVFGSGSGSGFSGQDYVTILTTTEYDVTVSRIDGRIANTYHAMDTSLPDCTGIIASKHSSPGIVTYHASVNGGAAYTPRESTGCHYADGTLVAFEILPNEPAITGVPTGGDTGPIRIEHR